MSEREAISILYNVASRMVRGTYLSELGSASEKQTTMRSSRIEAHLDRIEGLLKDDAVAIKRAIDVLSAEDSHP